MRIFDPESDGSGYNPYEFIPVYDEPKSKLRKTLDFISNFFNFICCFVGGLTIGWNLGKLLKYLSGDVNVSFSPW
jgi:hypothetical protein